MGIARFLSSDSGNGRIFLRSATPPILISGREVIQNDNLADDQSPGLSKAIISPSIKAKILPSIKMNNIGEFTISYLEN
jgi:hypothetical protein